MSISGYQISLGNQNPMQSPPPTDTYSYHFPSSGITSKRQGVTNLGPNSKRRQALKAKNQFAQLVTGHNDILNEPLSNDDQVLNIPVDRYAQVRQEMLCTSWISTIYASER